MNIKTKLSRLLIYYLKFCVIDHKLVPWNNIDLKRSTTQHIPIAAVNYKISFVANSNNSFNKIKKSFLALAFGNVRAN